MPSLYEFGNTGNATVTSGNNTGLYDQDGVNISIENNINTGNIFASGSITALGNITGNYIIGDGSLLTNVNAANIIGGYSNANVANYLPIYSGNVGDGSGYIFGNGAFLTGLPEQYGNANVANYLPVFGGNILAGNIQVVDGTTTATLTVTDGSNVWNISGEVITTPNGGQWRSDTLNNDEYITSAPDGYIDLQSLYANGNIASQLHLEHGLAQIITQNGTTETWTFYGNGEFSAPGAVVAVGNISGDYILGNGAFLTGLPAGYSNADVATFLANFGSNVIVTTGDITAGNFVGDGSQLTNLTGANITGTVANATYADFANVAFNVDAGNIVGNVQFANTAGFVTEANQSNITQVGNLVSLYVAGDTIMTGNLQVDGTVTAVNSNVVTINDKFINVANNASTGSLADGGGLGVGPVGSEYATLEYDNANTVWTTNIGLTVTGNITATGTVSGASISTAGNISGGNITATANITATGNITAQTFLGNGAIPAGGDEGAYLIKSSNADYDVEWADRVNAKTIFETVKNDSGGTLTKGTPVYQMGVTGLTITVAAARADDPTKSPAIGVLNETLADQAEGVMIVLGEIIGVDTSTFVTGDEVFLGATGGYVNAAPTLSNVAVQFLGVVNRVDAVNGSGFITGTARDDITKYQDGYTQTWTGNVWVPATELSSDPTPVLGNSLDGAGYNISNVAILTTTGNIIAGGNVNITGNLQGNGAYAADLSGTTASGKINIGNTQVNADTGLSLLNSSLLTAGYSANVQGAIAPTGIFTGVATVDYGSQNGNTSAAFNRVRLQNFVGHLQGNGANMWRLNNTAFNTFVRHPIISFNNLTLGTSQEGVFGTGNITMPTMTGTLVRLSAAAGNGVTTVANTFVTNGSFITTLNQGTGNVTVNNAVAFNVSGSIADANSLINNYYAYSMFATGPEGSGFSAFPGTAPTNYYFLYNDDARANSYTAGNLTAGNISATGSLATTGNLSAGNLTITVNTTTGTLTALGNVSLIGNLTGNGEFAANPTLTPDPGRIQVGNMSVSDGTNFAPNRNGLLTLGYYVDGNAATQPHAGIAVTGIMDYKDDQSQTSLNRFRGITTAYYITGNNANVLSAQSYAASPLLQQNYGSLGEKTQGQYADGNIHLGTFTATATNLQITAGAGKVTEINTIVGQNSRINTNGQATGNVIIDKAASFVATGTNSNENITQSWDTYYGYSMFRNGLGGSGLSNFTDGWTPNNYYFLYNDDDRAISYIAGNTEITGELAVGGDTYITGLVDITGNVEIGSNLTVTANGYFNANLFANTLSFNALQSPNEITAPGGLDAGLTGNVSANNIVAYADFYGDGIYGSAGELAVGNLVFNTGTSNSTTGIYQNQITNENAYSGTTTTMPLNSRILFGNGYQGSFGTAYDPIPHTRGARVVMSDYYQKSNTGLRTTELAVAPFVELTANLTSGTTRVGAITADLYIGGGANGYSVTQSAQQIRGINSAISLGNNGSVALGNISVFAAHNNLNGILVYPGSSIQHAIGVYHLPQNNSGNIAAMGNSYGIVGSSAGNTAVQNYYLTYMPGPNPGEPVGAPSAGNLWFSYNNNVTAKSKLGPINDYFESNYYVANVSGTANVDMSVSSYQVYELSGNVTIQGFDNEQSNQGNAYTLTDVCQVIFQSTTPQTVTFSLPGNFYYLNGNQTLEIDANKYGVATVRALWTGSQPNYIIDIQGSGSKSNVLVNGSGYNYANVAASNGRVTIVGGNAATHIANLASAANSVSMFNAAGDCGITLASDGNVNINVPTGSSAALNFENHSWYANGLIETTALDIGSSGFESASSINVSSLTLAGVMRGPLTTKTSGAAGTAGDICWDGDYIYVCVAANTWKRATLNTF